MLPETLSDIYCDDHVDPPFSHFGVGGIDVGLVGVIIVCLVFRSIAKRAAKDANAARDPGIELRPGYRFVAGHVELAEGEDVAVRTVVEQLGKEWRRKNSWHYSWTETSRSTTANPFYVRCGDGTRVRVEPGESILFVDRMEPIEFEDMRRTCVAELTPEEHVIIEGELRRHRDPEVPQGGGTYRDGGGRGWVMRAPAGGRLHASTESLGRRHELRARALGRLALLALGVLAGCTGLFAMYYARAGASELETVTVIDTRQYSTRARHGSHHHYSVNGAYTRDDVEYVFNREVGYGDFGRLHAGTQLFARVVSGWPFASCFGGGVSVLYHMLLMALAGLIFVLVMTYRAFTHRRWYEGKMNEKGRGRLPRHV